MNAAEIKALQCRLDELKAAATLTYHFIFAWQGPDGDNWMAMERWPADMHRHRNHLRAEARHPRFFEGHVRYLQDRFVFRCAGALDTLFRQAFEQTLSNGGLRDLHPWFTQDRVRRIEPVGEVEALESWFESAAEAEAEIARWRAMGLLAAAPPTVAAEALPPAEEDDSAALDRLPGLGCDYAALDAIDGDREAAHADDLDLLDEL